MCSYNFTFLANANTFGELSFLFTAKVFSGWKWKLMQIELAVYGKVHHSPLITDLLSQVYYRYSHTKEE